MVTRAVLFCTLVLLAAAARAQTPSTEDLRVADADNAAELTLSGGDRQFLQLAIDSGAKEVQLSQRALEKAHASGVKQFAQTMVYDHGATNRELMTLNDSLLGQKGPPFKNASANVKREIDDLDKLTGTQFDQRYLQIMVKDHKAAVDLYGQQAQRGQNPQLKALAQKTLPDLQRHLKLAQQLAGAK